MFNILEMNIVHDRIIESLEEVLESHLNHLPFNRELDDVPTRKVRKQIVYELVEIVYRKITLDGIWVPKLMIRVDAVFYLKLYFGELE
ncbi:hypothetical protein BN7_3004 [Wickerhamomyces ciferrii]|uniref:Uncharacterized protein n=1 Tax=Wickerhamomyces ciferrii (strain ATCC 14091 / BCRC 22168 / CBS 111 / JCM 3599 / NBRC 0793 / NRRL Y-1031 F-60-10) TaxID=1206466 RepID=K0KPV5_WICCF|nr:uncharacterized protein BN7_3004 [Wickerhamomyces ciferrii]CCH43454.1 hypothetical protein BN7_3004 [Wickerhamomyces ciferrii]